MYRNGELLVEADNNLMKGIAILLMLSINAFAVRDTMWSAAGLEGGFLQTKDVNE